MSEEIRPEVIIEYCPGCRWMLRAGWMAQEILSTFESQVGKVSLVPSRTSGTFTVNCDGQCVWDRKRDGGFPSVKELKGRLRDLIAPGEDLGHVDR